MAKTKFPKFRVYACVGDRINWQKDGFDITARLVADPDSTVEDRDYGALKVKQWKNDEWFFVGVVLSVSKNGIELSDHAASLWGIECNYNKRANTYLAEVALELESESLLVAKTRVSEFCEALCL